MSIMDDYMGPEFGPAELEAERKKQLERIGSLRGRAVMAYAARISPVPGIALPVDLNYSDLLPFYDVMSDLSGESVDVLLETPGGAGDIARDIVEMLHEKFRHVAFIVPGWAKSAGTIMAMGGHEILMGPTSALGPIDAQLQFEGKRFSAEALLEGMKQIQSDVKANGLNPAWIPMLQRVSPGDLQNAKNAMDFARVTVAEWLCKYKFSTWSSHRTNAPGTPVTEAEKLARATDIANELSSHSKWKTHSRSLRLPDLVAMRLEIVDYSKEAELNDAIMRYYVLQRLFLDNGNTVKLIENARRQVVIGFVPTPAPAGPATTLPGGVLPSGAGQSVLANLTCNKCGNVWKVQVDFDPGIPLAIGAIRFRDGGLPCRCGNVLDMAALRSHVEQQFGRPILAGEP